MSATVKAESINTSTWSGAGNGTTQYVEGMVRRWKRHAQCNPATWSGAGNGTTQHVAGMVRRWKRHAQRRRKCPTVTTNGE